MACIFPLHAHWFSGCIKDFIKRVEIQKPVPETKIVNPRSVPGAFYRLTPISTL
jgi:hypothetical protein